MSNTIENAPIVRKVDELGRIVLSHEIRIALGVSTGSTVTMQMQGNQLIIENHPEQCCYCHALAQSGKRLYSVDSKRFCQDCLKDLSGIFKETYEATLAE